MSIFDVEVFADEETERAEGAEDEEEEGGEELRVKIEKSIMLWQKYWKKKKKKEILKSVKIVLSV